MKHLAWMAAVAGLAMLPAPAQAMTVAEFLAKANALKAKGLFALGSPDIGLLKGEMKSIVEDYRAEIAGARKAGRPPHSCPAKGTKMSSNAFIADLEAIPVAQRGMSMKSAFYAIMKRRYPCPAR